jgi:hypothetical protein
VRSTECEAAHCAVQKVKRLTAQSSPLPCGRVQKKLTYIVCALSCCDLLVPKLNKLIIYTGDIMKQYIECVRVQLLVDGFGRF